ncbi:hypothetical protein [Candidatus Viridilinea mediisalina]|uniref:Thioredoxin-like fold domain-containing protein n=1 Tax=Candidatus Viridilinea mediisalina TaxID=2024553 RepID=A0A2A6RE01_9CHLR|nr:hypothetical protein [Candidatus Viridilinea mediisalina]PDW00182.1 hypothetical protein CJ255_20980 [Candidatus Viridilinea mediisalina]
MKPLRVYVSASCTVCDRTHQLVAELRRQRPTYPIELVDLDQPNAVKPDFVFGTPTYVLGERIVSLGNPTLATLINLLDTKNTLAALAGA